MIGKLLFTLVAVAVVWVGFKRFGIKDQSQKSERVRKTEEAAKAATEATVEKEMKQVEDLRPCPICGAYVSADTTCERCASKDS